MHALAANYKRTNQLWGQECIACSAGLFWPDALLTADYEESKGPAKGSGRQAERRGTREGGGEGGGGGETKWFLIFLLHPYPTFRKTKMSTKH